MTRHRTRRWTLRAGAAGLSGLLAGCLGDETDDGGDGAGADDDGPVAGSGADGGDDPDDGPEDGSEAGAEGAVVQAAGGETVERPADWPDDPSFAPNPDADGPGGDVTLAMQFEVRDYGDAEEFESFVVDFHRITLHDASGDTVDVPVDRRIDFYAHELETDIVLVFDAAIPAGTYTQVDYVADGVEIVHEEDGDVADQFEEPPRAELSQDGREMVSGEQWMLQSTLHLERWGPTFEESIAVGSYSGPGDMSDPSYFED